MKEVGAVFWRKVLRRSFPWILGILGWARADAFGQDLPLLPPVIPSLGVTLGWDANPEPDIVGYRLHFGIRPGVYIRRFDVGKVTEFRVPLPLPQRVYFFNVTAYNTAGLESDLGPELRYGAPPGTNTLESIPREASGPEDTSIPLDLQIPGDSAPTEWLTDPAPSHGRVEELLGVVRYHPAPEWNGTDTFSIITRLETDSPIRLDWTVTITPVEDRPSAADAWFTVEADSTLGLTLEGTDPDGDPLAYEIVVAPRSGSLSGTPPALVYRPAVGFVGTDRFTFRCSDGSRLSETAQVQIEVTPPVSADLVHDQTFIVLEDIPFSFHLDLIDPTNLVVRVVEGPEFGSVGGTSPNLLYLPPPEFSGTDRMVVEATDPEGHTDTGVILFEVEPLNDAPKAMPVLVSAIPGTPVELVLDGSDPEGDALTFEIVDEPTKGTLSGDPPRFTYLARWGESGSDVVTYRAFDGSDFSNLAQVTITLGTSPVEAPRVTATVGNSGLIQLRWNARPGLRYQVYVVDDLASASSWSPAGGPIAATSETAEWTGGIRWDIPARYYRVAVLSPD